MSGGAKAPERALLYARSATGDQQAIAAQLAKMRRYAATRSYAVASEVIDGPASGNSLDRPGLATIFRDTLHDPPRFDVLLVTDESRLGRDVSVANMIVSRLTVRGIRIEVIDHRGFDRSLVDRLLDTFVSYGSGTGPGDGHEKW